MEEMTENYILLGICITVLIIGLVATGFMIYSDGINKAKQNYCNQLGDCIVKEQAPIYTLMNKNNINFTDSCYCKYEGEK